MRAKPKYNVLLVIILVLSLFPVFLIAGRAATPAIGLGYQVTPPPGWTFNKVSANYACICPKTTKMFAPRVLVFVGQITKAQSLEMLTRLMNKEEEHSEKGFKRLSQGKITLDGVSASDTTIQFYIGTPPRLSQAHRVIALRKGHSFTFSYIGNVADYSSYEADFVKILRSVRWTN